MSEGSILKGRTTLVEQAARDATAWLPPPAPSSVPGVVSWIGDRGWLRDAQAYLPVDGGDPLSAVKGICIGIAISTALYAGIILAAVAAGLL